MGELNLDQGKQYLTITRLLHQLWTQISLRRRKQFGWLLVLMVGTSFAEVISIGAALPFLGALTAPAHIINSPLVKIFGISEVSQVVLLLTFFFGMAALLAGVMRLLLLWASTRLAFATGADLSIEIYRRTLYQPYEVHCARNSSEVINGISNKANSVIYNTIMPTLIFITSSIVLVAILIALFLIQPIVALAAIGGFSFIYASIIFVTRKRLMIDSKIIAKGSTLVIKSLQEGLGGIRDVLIDGSQGVYCQIYSDADLPLRKAQGNNQFISQSPRYAMEALGMILIAILAFLLSKQDGGISKAIPILGALALGAQRLLPVLQQVYASLTTVQGSQASLQDTLDLLAQPLPDYLEAEDIPLVTFERQISLKDLSCRYSLDAPWIFKDLNLIIPKGGRIGFIGTTGSGKSTLVDIVMGLLQPSRGGFEVDGVEITAVNRRSWQRHIAHVPQSIFLADSTIEENIAFGIPSDQIDHSRVKRAAEQAQISDSIEGWPKQYQTFVGEHGIRLSGGQRQRIGIARALYKEADVIVFDEATSALDSETEEAVMQAIESLSKELTLLIIAHRLTTLKSCTQIVELSDGNIKRIGRYQDIVKQSE